MITTHVAGIAIKIKQYAIQRCIICGHAIILDDLSKISVPDGGKLEPSFFKCGDLIEIDRRVGGVAQYISKVGELKEDFNPETDLPENICLDLLEL